MANFLFPFAYVPDPDKGKPVALGEMYFGEADKDPENFPIQVYAKQEDGTIVPISLGGAIELSSGGVPTYNGSPVQLLTEVSPYSLRVRDKHGAQKYFAEFVDGLLSDQDYQVKTYANLAEAVAAGGNVGDFVYVVERIAGGEVGGATYEIVSSNPNYLNSINHEKDDGNYLKYFGQQIDISQAGAVFDDSTDNSVAINNCFLEFTYVTNKNKGIARCEGIDITLNKTVFKNEGTIKLNSGATDKYLFNIEAEDCFIIGGYWDGNRLGGGQTTGNSWFDLELIKVSSTVNAHITGITGYNGAGVGIGIRGSSNCHVSNNTLRDIDQNAIYHDNDSSQNTYTENDIDVSAASINSSGQHHGILLSNSDPATNFNNLVSNNTIKAQLTGATTGNICIAVRGYQCNVSNNITYGGNMGLSIDRATDSVIADNLIYDVDLTAGSSYGIEMNGPRNTVTGNKIKGAKYGIVTSGNLDPMTDNIISSNSIDGVERGIFVSTHTGSPCTGWTITGNYISSSDDCIYLTDFGDFSITGNNLTLSDTLRYPIFFNTPTNESVNTIISNNFFDGGARFYALFSAAAIAYTDIIMENNRYLNITNTRPINTGTGTFGMNIQFERTLNTGNEARYIDYANDILNVFGYTGSPEGAVSASMGSMITSDNGNIYRKTTNGVNTGWVTV